MYKLKFLNYTHISEIKFGQDVGGPHMSIGEGIHIFNAQSLQGRNSLILHASVTSRMPPPQNAGACALKLAV